MAKAFRCKNCGRLEEADHAGDRSVPLSCRACGRGVKFDQHTGTKSADPSNWEVLHECSDARLKELGLTRDRVCKHDGKCDSPVDTGRRVESSASG